MTIMPRFVAISTSNASLVRCELDRVRPHVELDDDDLVVGVGAYAETVVLHRSYGPSIPRAGLWEAPDSDSVVLAAAKLAVGQPVETSAQPFRFRQWLFGHAGTIDQPERVRERLISHLPEFLGRSVRGVTLSEAIFATFLSELRLLGRMEDMLLEAPIAAQVLQRTGRIVEQASADEGGTAKSHLAMVATNGHVLVAARRGNQALAYSLLEGEPTCHRHGLTSASNDKEPLVRDHRRRKSVVLATHPLRMDTWVAVPDGGAVAVDRRLQIQLL